MKRWALLTVLLCVVCLTVAATCEAEPILGAKENDVSSSNTVKEVGGSFQEHPLGILHKERLCEFISKDMCHLAYVTRLQPAGKWLAVVDGQVVMESERLDQLRYPNDWRLAFVTERSRERGTVRVVVDGRFGPEYDDVQHLLLSPDGKHVAYVARSGVNYSVVVDGRAGSLYDFIGKETPTHRNIRMQFSPDGKHLAYVAKKRNQHCLVTDGIAGPLFDHIGVFQFSPDGKRIAYVARTRNKSCIVTDGRAGPLYDHIEDDPLIGASMQFSPDSKCLAYAARKGNSYVMLKDGRMEALPGPIQHLQFSSDSKHMAYAVKENKRWMISVDGKNRLIESNDICSFRMNMDATLLAHVVRIPEETTLISSTTSKKPYYDTVTLKKNEKFPGKFPQKELITTEETRRINKFETWCVFVQGQAGPELDRIMEATLQISPDSKHVMYCAWRDVRRAQAYSNTGNRPGIYTHHVTLFVDAQEAPKYDAIVGYELGATPSTGAKEYGLAFRPDGSLEFLARKKDVLYRVHWSARQ